MKCWVGSNRNNYQCRRINRVMVKECVSYYVKCWHERNQVRNDPVIKREHAIEWAKRLEKKISTSNKVDAIKCLNLHVLNNMKGKSHRMEWGFCLSFLFTISSTVIQS